MKRVVCILLLVAMLVISVPACAAQYAYVKTPNVNGSVNVRKTPGTGQPVVGYAKNGDQLEIIYRGNTWHCVRVVRTGIQGYIYGEYIDFGQTELPEDDWTQPGDGWGDIPVDPWSPTYGYTPDISLLDGDTVINCDALVSSSDGYGNVRWGAGFEYDIMGSIRNGNIVWALEKVGDWYRCALPDGRIGYMYRTLLKIEDTSVSAFGKSGVVRASDGFASIRAGASTSNKELYRLLVGQPASVYGAKGQWFRVYNTQGWQDAYVHRSLLRFNWRAQTTGSVNLRTGPSVNNAQIRVLPAGTQITLLATDGNFCRVDTGREIGYISRTYIRY